MQCPKCNTDITVDDGAECPHCHAELDTDGRSAPVPEENGQAPPPQTALDETAAEIVKDFESHLHDAATETVDQEPASLRDKSSRDGHGAEEFRLSSPRPRRARAHGSPEADQNTSIKRSRDEDIHPAQLELFQEEQFDNIVITPGPEEQSHDDEKIEQELPAAACDSEPVLDEMESLDPDDLDDETPSVSDRPSSRVMPVMVVLLFCLFAGAGGLLYFFPGAVDLLLSGPGSNAGEHKRTVVPLQETQGKAEQEFGPGRKTEIDRPVQFTDLVSTFSASENNDAGRKENHSTAAEEVRQTSPVQEEPTAGAAYYTLQAMTLSFKDRAETLAEKLAEKYHPVYIITQKNSDNKMLYKIRIGKYATEEEARQAAAMLEKHEKLSALIVETRG